MDRLTHSRRSWLMSRVRSKDTGPERAVRSIVHNMGFRFRLHRADLPGRPDIVLPKLRSVIFVHGCFWHRHRNCPKASTPSTRTEFWSEKFQRNVERDKLAVRELRSLGWRILVVWQCELRDKKMLTFKLSQFLGLNPAQN